MSRVKNNFKLYLVIDTQSDCTKMVAMQLNLIRNNLNNYDLATRGAIISMLLLLRVRDGHILNDDAVLAKMLNIQIRTWRKMKATLIQDNIISVDGDDIMSNMYDVSATEFTPNFAPIIDCLTLISDVCPKVYPKHDSTYTDLNNETNMKDIEQAPKDEVDAGVAADCLNSPMETNDENSEIDGKERKSLTKRKKSKPQELYTPLKRGYNTKGFPISAPPYTREEALRDPVPVPLHVLVKPWLEQQHCRTSLMEIEVDDLEGLEDLFTTYYEAQGWVTPGGAKITDREAKFKYWVQTANMNKKNQYLCTGGQMESNYKPVTDYDKFI